MAGLTRTRMADVDANAAAGAVRTRAEMAPIPGGTMRVPERRISWGAREVMDIRQASEYLGISPDSLYKYASENFIPAFKLGNRWRFKRSLLERWMEQQSLMGSAPAQPKSAKPKQKKPVTRAR